MGFFGLGDSDERDERDPRYQEILDTEVDREKHEGHFTHELIGGAAGFEAMRMYNKHCEKEGKPQSYALAKELLAGFAVAATDKLIETKGLDWIDAHRAKERAKEQAEQAARRDFGEDERRDEESRPGAQKYGQSSEYGSVGQQYGRTGGDYQSQGGQQYGRTGGHYEGRSGQDYGRTGGDYEGQGGQQYGRTGGDYEGSGQEYGRTGGDYEGRGGQEYGRTGGDYERRGGQEYGCSGADY